MNYDWNEIADERLQANYISPDFIEHLKDSGVHYEQLRRVDLGSCRYYYTKNEQGKITLYPGVTSVLQSQMPLEYGLLQWYATNGMAKCKEILFERSLYGTLMHIVFSEYIAVQGNTFNKGMINEIFEEYVSGRPYYQQRTIREYYESERYIDDLYRDLLCLHTFMLEKNVLVIANEISLHSISNCGSFAGTIDLICELDFNKKRQIAIIDFKSKRNGASYSSNIFQLHAYRQLWENNFAESGGFEIDMAFNFFPNDWQKVPTYKLLNQTKKFNSENVHNVFDNYLDNFYLQNNSVDVLESQILNIETTIKKSETFVPNQITLESFLLNHTI